MKREVERERKLPAFSITVGDLGALWKRLLPLFENQEDVHGSFDITLAREKLEFKNIDELSQFRDLKGKVTNFSLWLSKGGRRVSIRSGGLFYGRPTVRATAENESWCAGAVETIHSFMQSHKLWYSWFVSAPIGWIFLLFANIPAIAMVTLPKGTITNAMLLGWLATVIALAFFISPEGNCFLRRFYV